MKLGRHFRAASRKEKAYLRVIVGSLGGQSSKSCSVNRAQLLFRKRFIFLAILKHQFGQPNFLDVLRNNSYSIFILQLSRQNC